MIYGAGAAAMLVTGLLEARAIADVSTSSVLLSDALFDRLWIDWAGIQVLLVLLPAIAAVGNRSASAAPGDHPRIGLISVGSSCLWLAGAALLTVPISGNGGGWFSHDAQAEVVESGQALLGKGLATLGLTITAAGLR